MALKFDPEFYAALEPLLPMLQARPKLEAHDVEGRRQMMAAGLVAMMQMADTPPAPDVEITEHKIPTPSGTEISLFSYIKKGEAGAKPGPAILHCHGKCNGRNDVVELLFPRFSLPR
jgi:acetyl esterase/lipase